MSSARELAEEIERKAPLPEVPERERFWGYAVVGLPFRSGHVLALRRFPATSIGPGYTSVWHRDPDGRWTIYQDQSPSCTCPRAFGPAIDAAPTVPIELEWSGPEELRVEIDASPGLSWRLSLGRTAATRALNAVSSVLPAPVRRHPLTLGIAGRLAGPLLGAGRLRLAGRVPAGSDFAADLRRIWTVPRSAARLAGDDLGELGPLPAQARMADFWLPQRGLFAVGGSFFEPYDPSRHELVATRHD